MSKPSPKSKQTEMAERRVRLIGYIKAGYSAEQIADVEGLGADYVRTTRRTLAREEGLTYSDQAVPFDPIGHDNDLIDRQVRIKLAFMLQDLENGRSEDELSRLTGLTRAEHRRARATDKLSHNWTLAQMKRIAVAYQLDLRALLVRIATPPIDIDIKKGI